MRRLVLSHDQRTRRLPERLLLAVDFGGPSLAAARWAARHLAPDAEVVLAHVVPVPRPPAFLHGVLRAPDRFVHHVTGAMRGGLEGLATTLGSPRVRVELRVGDPAEQLAELAAAHGVDLVCVGRPRQRGDTVKLGRNTVDRLLRRLTVPLVQATGALDAPPMRILAAVDDGAVSDAVLRRAWSLAARLEARLTAVHVLDDGLRAYVRALEVTAGRAADAPAVEETLWGTTADWLAAGLTRAGARPGRAHPMVGRGDPGQELLGACRRTAADLLVVGRAGRDAIAAGAVGSTTRLVLRAAPCPILVVPDGAGPSDTPHDDGRWSRSHAGRLAAIGTAPVAPHATTVDLPSHPGGDDGPPPAARRSGRAAAHRREVSRSAPDLRSRDTGRAS